MARHFLALPPLGEASLFDVRGVGPIPDWATGTAVVAGFFATLGLTLAEFRAHGTAFGYPGPAVWMLVVPIAEELVFRGWMLGRLTRRFDAARGIAISAALFGLVHLRNLAWRDGSRVAGQVLWAALVLGPLLAWVTLRTRSVWPAVVLHYANNLTYYLDDPG